jgi:hypothetical protein
VGLSIIIDHKVKKNKKKNHKEKDAKELVRKVLRMNGGRFKPPFYVP